jgi:hypothetical protein
MLYRSIPLPNKQHRVNYNLIWKAHKNPVPYPLTDQRLDALPTLSWLWPGWIPRGLLSLPPIPMTVDTIRGSSHIPAIACNVLGLQWVHGNLDLDRNGPRTLRVIKSNLDPRPET